MKEVTNVRIVTAALAEGFNAPVFAQESAALDVMRKLELLSSDMQPSTELARVSDSELASLMGGYLMCLSAELLSGLGGKVWLASESSLLSESGLVEIEMECGDALLRLTVMETEADVLMLYLSGEGRATKYAPRLSAEGYGPYWMAIGAREEELPYREAVLALLAQCRGLPTQSQASALEAALEEEGPKMLALVPGMLADLRETLPLQVLCGMASVEAARDASSDKDFNCLAYRFEYLEEEFVLERHGNRLTLERGTEFHGVIVRPGRAVAGIHPVAEGFQGSENLEAMRSLWQVLEQDLPTP